MFEAGEKVFIRTVTFHQVGEVVGVVDGFVVLTQASWVADSGRFSAALQNGDLTEVEYVGECSVNMASIVDTFPWTHDLPTATK